MDLPVAMQQSLSPKELAAASVRILARRLMFYEEVLAEIERSEAMVIQDARELARAARGLSDSMLALKVAANRERSRT